MPPLREKVTGAMFDVRPVDHTGSVDFAKIQRILPSVNLRQKPPQKKAAPVALASSPIKTEQAPPIEKKSSPTVTPVASAPVVTRDDMLRYLEQSINTPHDHKAVLTNMGARVTETGRLAKPHYRPVLPRKRQSEEQHHNRIISELHHSQRHQPAQSTISADPEIHPTLVTATSSHADAAVEQWMRGARPRQTASLVTHSAPEKPSRSWWQKKVFMAALVLPLAFIAHYALGLKGRVIEDGNQAVHSLESAKDNLTNLDFAAASENFLSAYDDFSKAGDQLNFMGANLGGLLSDLPGASKLKSAQSMVEIGKLIADTGRSMATAMSVVSRTGLILNPQGSSNMLLSEIIKPLNDALGASDSNLKKVGSLLATIDTSIIPEEKRATFEEFKAQYPQMQELVTQGSDFAKFLENFIGVKGTKRYIILFQNSSELRPTGGFPGSYALLTFENGRLKEYLVDDIYNIDGQLKEAIIPPLQLQHITPTWAMRDANWFIDFPTSAKKIAAFYKKESGLTLDGVLTLSPDLFKDILKVIGPVEMPAYNVTITSENFLATIQNEVEYGENKKDNKPKKILTDMAPIVLERLYSANHEKWLEVFNAFMSGLERKDMLMYFRDLNLQSFSMEKGFAGEVKQVDSDYVMVTMTNVKGSKTDTVTDTVLKMGTYLAGGEIRHKLIIGRTHNGGKTKYGFYNKQNPSYVRVLVPQGSSLLSINGQSVPAFGPLVDYSQGFQKDDDLVRFERSFVEGRQPGVSVYEESGKTGFGFWMIVDPGSTRTVELEYSVPASVVKSDYSLYVQKQPGLNIRSFNFEFSKPEDITIGSAMPSLNKIGDLYTFSGKLEKDLPITIKLQ